MHAVREALEILVKGFQTIYIALKEISKIWWCLKQINGITAELKEMLVSRHLLTKSNIE